MFAGRRAFRRGICYRQRVFFGQVKYTLKKCPKVLAVDFGNKKKELSYLSEIEKQIRDIVVFKKPKIVEIAFENENIKPIVVTEQHKTREQLARYILEHKIAKGAKLLIEIRAQGNYKLTLIKN